MSTDRLIWAGIMLNAVNSAQRFGIIICSIAAMLSVLPTAFSFFSNFWNAAKAQIKKQI